MKDNQMKIAQDKSGLTKAQLAKLLMKGPILKPLSISMALMFFQQFTGINAMVFYTVSIFKSAGSTIDSHYATIIVGFVQLIFTATSGIFVSRILLTKYLR